MHWYAPMLLLLGIACALRLHVLAFALVSVLIILAVAAWDIWSRLGFLEMALDIASATVALQLGYVLGVVAQVMFKRLSAGRNSSSSKN